MITIAHLLDDFGLGGLTRSLTLFEEPMMKRKAHSKVVYVQPRIALAPQIKADLIVDHAALSWRRLVFLISLKTRNPEARIVHIEHGYTQSFEANKVLVKGRFRLMLRLTAKLFDHFICVSKAQKDWIVSTVGLNRKKVSVIHPWTDRTDLFSVPSAPARFGGPVQLLAYGRYRTEKNFGELIAAMRSFGPSEARLTILGDGPERTVLRALAADLPHVKVLCQGSSPAPYLTRCDALIVPSVQEGFGLAATEARMAGRAVIAADIDGLPEQCAGGGGYVAPMQSAYDIAQAIRAATRMDLAAMGRAGRRDVKSHHPKILRAWSALIKDIEAKQAGSSSSTETNELGEAAV